MSTKRNYLCLKTLRYTIYIWVWVFPEKFTGRMLNTPILKKDSMAETFLWILEISKNIHFEDLMWKSASVDSLISIIIQKVLSFDRDGSWKK